MRDARRGLSQALVLMALLAAMPQAAGAAGREKVLAQIRVPHDYYYREMYLPQVTSGPNAVAWSPDGSSLVYAMQGRLWRQRPDSDEAFELTQGASYDHQPDWSPDGRSIVYVAYQDDAMELRLLDLESLSSRPLTSNGAVNLEPRFSPDGKRIAFVSTLFEGRFHILVMDVRNGEPGPARRLSADHESDLPRYYYSRFDHYLSPSWSPDGTEILFVSNRDRIWGTGGFWRMRAEPDASPRQIHYEETTWKARPDWSRDGKRIAYASYLGRQWHQLWVMTAEGGDPLPLSYGEYDVTAPRWSPDGRRIAYVSNESGDTAIQVQEIPGGHRRQIRASRRHYRGPVGHLRLRIVDRSTGQPTAARVSVIDASGRGYAPDAAWRHADDAFDRSQRAFEHSYFHASGSADLALPAGDVHIEVLRGLEYRPFRHRARIEKDGVVEVEVGLERIADLAAEGWFSGDLHVHMNYGGAYRNDPERLAFQASAEDLDLIENLIVNKEQRIPDVSWFDGTPDGFPQQGVVINHGQEFHTSFWGHLGLLGLRDHVLLPDYAAYANTAAASLYPPNATILDLARAQGGVGGYVHPFDALPDPSDADTPLTNELPVDVALGKVDYYEAVGFVEDPFATQEVWYRLLNCGFRLPAGAGTDAMANFASLRGPVGLNRVYVKTGAPLEHRRFLDALVAGRSFATNAPLLALELGDAEIGGVIQLPAGSQRLVVDASMRSLVPVDHLELIRNGEVMAKLPIDEAGTSGGARREIEVDASGWYLLRAWNSKATHPVLDRLPFATTSPIYVEVGGQPLRSPDDANYFVAWIDRLIAAAEAHTGYNTAAEKAEVSKLLAAAREVFRERASGEASATRDAERLYQQARALRDEIEVTRSRGADTTLEGVPLAGLVARYGAARAKLVPALADGAFPSAPPATESDARALAIMRGTLATELVEEEPALAPADAEPAPDCRYDPERVAGGEEALSQRIYACFAKAAGSLRFEGEELDRLTVFGRLPLTDEPSRREALWRALAPVWESVDGDGTARSPYRTLVRMRAARMRERGEALGESLRLIGVEPARMETWLTSVLERWHESTPERAIDPWDFGYQAGAASRELYAALPLASLREVNDRFYRDLGTDPTALDVRYDLAPRASKDPVAFTTFGRRPSLADDTPGEPWVFASYRIGGLDNLAELLHETGHAIHIAAIRTRPAFADWPDSDIFTEAIADLASLELYEPAWQQRYLGRSVPDEAGIRAKYAGVVMDMAWALFELRVHREPDRDPNAVWTEITQRYFRIRPQPELAWWAVRGQLIDAPGYMMNYAAGAILVADLRAVLHERHGRFDAGDPEWYARVSEQLYRFGLERPSKQVIEDFLGRPVSPQALLDDMRRAGSGS